MNEQEVEGILMNQAIILKEHSYALKMHGQLIKDTLVMLSNTVDKLEKIREQL